MNWRDVARSGMERALFAAGIPRFSRGSMRGRTLVLAYHNIVPRGERSVGDRSLHLPQDSFGAQLDLLLETHDLIALDQVDEPLPDDRPRIAITFDDAYAGAMTAGMDELRARRIPATVFVAPAFVGGGSFWWDMLADPREGLAPQLRDYALEVGRGRHEQVLAWARSEGIGMHELPEFARCSSVSDLARAAVTPGISIGSHTWSHANLARLEPAELQDELHRPIAWLDERFPSERRWISYPYGRHNAGVQQATRAAGYAGAFLVEGGWCVESSSDRTTLPRLNVPAGLSPNGLAIRAAGLLCG